MDWQRASTHHRIVHFRVDKKKKVGFNCSQALKFLLKEGFMKKLLVVAVVFAVMAFAVGSAFAAGSNTNTGCGLGSLAWQGKADSTLFQAFEATTNGTSGSQTFGITTGTSNCTTPSKFVSNERTNEFVVANMDNLAKDIARGSGETLEAFADLMQVPTGERAAFYQKLQTSFAKIFTSEDVVLASVMDNVATLR
jgi:hypothetical protein